MSLWKPDARSRLKQFGADFDLPDPPSLTVLAPLGTVPFDPTNPEMITWAFETTLDVEWAHAMAPGAKIVVLTSPVGETQGVQGLPELLALETYALDHHLGTIISQSWATAENTLFTPQGQAVIAGFSRLYERARDERVTVLSSAGDTGSANLEPDGTTFYPFPTWVPGLIAAGHRRRRNVALYQYFGNLPVRDGVERRRRRRGRRHQSDIPDA